MLILVPSGRFGSAAKAPFAEHFAAETDAPAAGATTLS
jgi:hypothetical protein